MWLSRGLTLKSKSRMNWWMSYTQQLSTLESVLPNVSRMTIDEGDRQRDKELTYATSVEPNRAKFGILLGLQCLSFPCFVYIFYHYVSRRNHFRRAIHYDVIFVLLFVSFLFVTTSLPLTEIYLFSSYVYPPNDIFCSLWICFHYSLNIINLFLMAFASIERHLLIFHSQFLQNSRRKFFFHTCPILFCLIYPSMFYIAAIFLYPCQNTYDYTQLLCTWPCYFWNRTWAYVDLFFNNYAPLFAIPVFCSVLYFRVFLQRRAMRQQAVKWSRDRKLIIQLWLISTLYLGMWMPLQMAGLINLFFDSDFLVQAQIDYMYLFPYVVHLVYPFIVLSIIHPTTQIRPTHTGQLHPTPQPK